MSRAIILILAAIFITACQDKLLDSNLNLGIVEVPNEALDLEEEIEIEAPSTAEPPSPQEALERGSKIIKRGYMKFEVDKLELAKRRVDSILSSYSGYFEKEEYNAYGNRIAYALQLRVPNKNFDSVIVSIEQGTGKLKSKNITAKDVTEEYVDLNIRLDNNLAYLDQYKTILRKAKSVKEILQVQEKIRRIEEEIESKKGRLKYLNDKVKFSTLKLELSELLPAEQTKRPGYGKRLVGAFNDGFKSFLSSILAVVSLWPFLIFGVLLFFSRKPLLKRIKKVG